MRKIDKLILHHSLTKDSITVSWDAIRRYHTEEKHFSDIGYHFGIERIGEHIEILRGRPIIKAGAHTIGENSSSIGICCVGNFDIEPPDDDVIDTVVSLCADLCYVLRLDPLTDIYGHHIFATYKTCPGTKFDVRAVAILTDDVLRTS